MKEVIIVYQDCPMCGARKKWGETTLKEAQNAKASVRKVSFVTREGEELCGKAVLKGIKRLPFVTDGNNFAYDVKSLLETASEPKKRKTTKTKKTKQKEEEE